MHFFACYVCILVMDVVSALFYIWLMSSVYQSTGLTKLESLSIKWCNCITDADMKPLSGDSYIAFATAIW